MSDKPIHMAEPLVLATLQGRKTVTRRPMRGIPPEAKLLSWDAITGRARFRVGQRERNVNAPYIRGDRLYVRERASVVDLAYEPDEAVWGRVQVLYAADAAISGWIPYPRRLVVPCFDRCIANGCYREACRLWLPVTEVRPERLQSITEDEAWAEGVLASRQDAEASGKTLTDDIPSARRLFSRLWDECYGPGAWASDPWVWVIRWATPDIRQVAA